MIRRLFCLIGWHEWVDQTWASWKTGPADIRCDWCDRQKGGGRNDE